MRSNTAESEKPIYFHVGPFGNKRRFRAEARIKAMAHLRRVDFNFEQVYQQDAADLTALPGCDGYFAKAVFWTQPENKGGSDAR